MSIDLEAPVHYSANYDPKIAVVGVGGAGGNAVDNMIKRGIDGVHFITANTDQQALNRTLANEKILLGPKLTKGLGAGAKPEIGRKATEEVLEQIKAALEGYDLIFITCGQGGGTGTGGSSLIAKVAKENGALVVGIVSKCFSREGSNKTQLAESGIATLKENVDAIIVVPNDTILEVCKEIRPIEAYSKANDILYNATRAIVRIIVNHSVMNVDFADVRTALTDIGEVIIGIGTATGANAGKDAVFNALNSPFFDGLAIKNTNHILFDIQAGNHPIEQINAAYIALQEAAGGEDLKLIPGEDYSDSDEFTVVIIAPAIRNSKDKKNDNKSTKEQKQATVTEIENPIIETKQPAKQRKPIVRYNSDKTNLFSTDDANKNEIITNPADLINANNKIKNVAANSNETIESLEIIAGVYQATTMNRQFGRPHGEAELKKFDAPTYLRRGKSESKYNIITDIADETDETNTLPEENDKQKIQNLVNGVSDKIANKFVNQISERSTNSTKKR